MHKTLHRLLSGYTAGKRHAQGQSAHSAATFSDGDPPPIESYEWEKLRSNRLESSSIRAGRLRDVRFENRDGVHSLLR
jgi:hypothetical protein